MSETDVQQYKPVKTTIQQIEYLKNNKRVTFNEIGEDEASKLLLRYNYINIISPYKHRFAKIDDNRKVVKQGGKHVYERNVDFKEYYDCFILERQKYPRMVKNVLEFEIHFKSILAYHVLNKYKLSDSNLLEAFLDNLKINISLNQTEKLKKKKKQKKEQIDELIHEISEYADVYCFFDRMTLGKTLTIYSSIPYDLQNVIFADLKKFGMTFNVNKVPEFIDKVFCMVAIRNCIMHCNSLEILVRFYNPKTRYLRKVSDKKKFQSMINYLCQ